jgi:two-component system sensor kinase FixL
MPTPTPPLTQTLTARWLLSLLVVAALAWANYIVLRAEIHANEVGGELLAVSGRQRTLLQSSGLLSHELVTEQDPARTRQLREELLTTADALEAAHFQLAEFDPLEDGRPLPGVQDIYENSPWLLDTEVRNYLTHLRQLTRSEDPELNRLNPLYGYIREAVRSRRIISGLDEVVAAYRTVSDQRARRLREMARWSLGSTWVVLALTGLFVFRPMVLEVRQNVTALHGLNETLEARVAERTAIAEERTRRLADSEALYQSLVDNLPLAVVRKDLAGRFTYVNRLYHELTGRTDAEVIGATDRDLAAHDEALRWQRDDEQVIRSGTPLTRIRQSEADDGRHAYVESITAPVTDATGDVIGTQTAFWDVSERKAAEERMLRAERLAAVGEMVAGVAHESRNALQQIGACAKMLLWELEERPEAVGMVDDVLHAHDRLHRLFENLRGYVSPLKLERRPAQLAELLCQAWQEMRRQHPDREAELRQVGAETSTCRVDAFTMGQVFRNLLDNSLAAVDGPLLVTARWESITLGDQPAVRLTFCDNGPGIPRQIAERIFEPFFTTRTQGTGLGMVIVRRILEAHGGGIELLSEARQHTSPGAGARFGIDLPRGTP